MTETREEREVIHDVQAPLGTPVVPVDSAYPAYPATPVVGSVAGPVVSSSSSAHKVTQTVSGYETGRRLIFLGFGVVQALIVIRFLLLILAARETGLVSGIEDFSGLFVGPFIGIFKQDVSGGHILEYASIAAFIGWTLVEAFVLILYKIVSRKPS